MALLQPVAEQLQHQLFDWVVGNCFKQLLILEDSYKVGLVGSQAILLRKTQGLLETVPSEVGTPIPISCWQPSRFFASQYLGPKLA